MSRPSYACLRRDKESGQTGVHFFGTFLHPRPEFYKHYFYLFTEDSPQEGRAFFNKDNRMCVATYQKRCEEIKASGDLAYAYNRRHPRRGGGDAIRRGPSKMGECGVGATARRRPRSAP